MRGVVPPEGDTASDFLALGGFFSAQFDGIRRPDDGGRSRMVA
jgi:hypothetical protein